MQKVIFLAICGLIMLSLGCQRTSDAPATRSPFDAVGEDDQMTVTLKDTTSLEDLRGLFNRDLGQTRILLLLSPT